MKRNNSQTLTVVTLINDFNISSLRKLLNMFKVHGYHYKKKIKNKITFVGFSDPQ